MSTSMTEPVNLDKFLIVAGNLEMALYQKRLATYADKWRYTGVEGAKCTTDKMARAGFYCTGDGPGSSDSAKCYVCQHELLWDAEDDPWEEHCRHRPDCQLVKTGKQDEREFTMLEQLQIFAYIYSSINYEHVDEAIENLKMLMHRLLLDTEKATGIRRDKTE